MPQNSILKLEKLVFSIRINWLCSELSGEYLKLILVFSILLIFKKCHFNVFLSCKVTLQQIQILKMYQTEIVEQSLLVLMLKSILP